MFLFLNEACDNYKQFNFFGKTNEYSLKFSKKNKLFFNKTKNISTPVVQTENNRKKNYLLNEGDNIPPLVDIGVFPNISSLAYVDGKLYVSSRTKSRIAVVDYLMSSESLLNVLFTIETKSQSSVLLFFPKSINIQ